MGGLGGADLGPVIPALPATQVLLPRLASAVLLVVAALVAARLGQQPFDPV
jgi:hypothetical protein